MQCAVSYRKLLSRPVGARIGLHRCASVSLTLSNTAGGLVLPCNGLPWAPHLPLVLQPGWPIMMACLSVLYVIVVTPSKVLFSLLGLHLSDACFQT